MIISHKHKFIFIKTFKTAGTSLEVFLSPHCGEEDVLTPIFPHIEPHVARNYQGYFNPFPQLWSGKGRRAGRIIRELIRRKHFYGHMPGHVIRDRIPARIWNSYFKFCVERNPWDKALSYYHMKNYRADGKLTLEQYFARGRFRTNFEKYTDSKGRLLVDKVVKYENLSEGLGAIFSELGIPFEGSLGTRAKSEYRSDRRPCREVLTDSQMEIIAKAYASEIRMHGYQP
jgi:hypothetical protein